jgi:hypothetical protein
LPSVASAGDSDAKPRPPASQDRGRQAAGIAAEIEKRRYRSRETKRRGESGFRLRD